jgi:hypothetical protein
MATLNVFSKGGYVLYSNGKVEGNALNRLVSEHLLEARPLPEFVTGGQTIRWKSDNDRDVIYAVGKDALFRPIPKSHFFPLLSLSALFADGSAAEASGRRTRSHCAQL